MRIICHLFFVIFLFGGCNKASEAPNPMPPAGLAGAQKAAPKGNVVTDMHLEGTVIDVKTHEAFTFVRIESREVDGGPNKNWVALIGAQVKVGDTVEIEADVLQRNFHARGLGKTFDEIYFGRVIEPDGASAPHLHR